MDLNYLTVFCESTKVVSRYLSSPCKNDLFEIHDDKVANPENHGYELFEVFSESIEVVSRYLSSWRHWMNSLRVFSIFGVKFYILFAKVLEMVFCLAWHKPAHLGALTGKSHKTSYIILFSLVLYYEINMIWLLILFFSS